MIKNDLLKILRSIDDLDDIDFVIENNLVSGGRLDSSSILVIVARIERHFNVQLKVAGDLAQDFDSLAKMEALVGAALHGTNPARSP